MMDNLYTLDGMEKEELPDCDPYLNGDHSNCNSEGCLFDFGGLT